LSASATSTPGAWLFFSAFSNSQVAPGGTATFTLYANASGLTTGSNYQGTVTVTPSTGTALAIPVTFTAGGSGNGTWNVSPNSVPWSFNTSSPQFLSQPISVSTTSGSVYYNVTPAAATAGCWSARTAATHGTLSNIFIISVRGENR
jgi:hypothetical protein